MQEKIDKLQEEMYGIRGEIKVMNATQKAINDTLKEFKDISTKVHLIELKLAVDGAKIGTGERVIWLLVTTVIAAGVAFIK